MKFELVFIPYPAIGHLKSAVEVAKLLVERETRLSISIIIIPFISRGEEVGVSDYITALSATSNDRYKFIFTEDQPTTEPTMNVNLHIENQVPKVRSAVAKLLDAYSTQPDSPRIAGFVLDMFCTSMIDVANEFELPSYLFFASSAGILSLGFHIQVLYDEKKYNVTEDSEAELIVPSLTRSYPVKCLPYSLLSKEMVLIYVHLSRRFKEMKGILINTVEELEPYVLKFLLNDDDIPLVYSVGPVLHLENNQVDDDDSKNEKQSEIILWLDEQPASSVVFLCFGSLGGFSEEQAREIAIALERSGQRFLWSLRRELPGEFTNLDEVLPEGFFDRTKEIGKVIGWAPQVAVLANPAVGGFVTHCGWNSMLESLWFGVPMAAWPLYAEQKFNAFEMVEELGLAVEIKKYWRGDLLLGRSEMEIVTAEEIERGLRCLMQQDSDVRKRVKEMSEICQVAVMDGGTSRIALEKFVQDVTKNIV